MVRQINHNDDILFKQLREFEKKTVSDKFTNEFSLDKRYDVLEAVLLIFKIVFFFWRSNEARLCVHS